MKRFILMLLSLFFMATAVNAQLSKGDFLVGGGVGLVLDIGNSGDGGIWGGSSTDVDVTFALSPSVMYMITDNWYFGGGLDLGVTPSVGGTATIFSIGPEGGYHVSFNKTLGLFNSLEMDFGVAEKAFFFGFNYYPKLSIALSDKTYLTATLAGVGYNSSSESFSIKLLTQTAIGFYYAF